MAVLFRADGTRATLTPASPAGFSLSQLQALIGGYLEMLPLPSPPSLPPGGRLVLFLDEEGKLKDRPLNVDATALAHAYDALSLYDYLAGDVLMVTVLHPGTDDETVL